MKTPPRTHIFLKNKKVKKKLEKRKNEKIFPKKNYYWRDSWRD